MISAFLNVVAAILAGYLLASLLLPTIDVYRAVAEPARPIKIISKYQAWNLLYRR